MTFHICEKSTKESDGEMGIIVKQAKINQI